MSSGFLSLPLQLDKVPQRGLLATCSVRESIAHHIHLLLTTSLGEMASNERFGCGLWDTDFDSLSSRSRLKDQIVQALDEAIRLHEPRLERVRTELQLHQDELNNDGVSRRDGMSSGNGGSRGDGMSRRIKNRLDITVSGVLKGTNETIVYRDHFFISPLSYN
ncbi:GPW/gp25 family protein [Puia sp.]|jgi:phage baseplate assembly protein W|uniref:GPW/gp25 family protein n=1 Tax=Puia sp. TaxID=2045100 RepID=UPI002F418FB1